MNPFLGENKNNFFNFGLKLGSYKLEVNQQ